MSKNATILITLALQNKQQELDLQLPADRPVVELLPFFQQLCKPWVPNENIDTYSQVWAKAFDGSGLRSLSLGQSLSVADVRDGDRLELVQAPWQTGSQGSGQRSQFYIPARAYPEPLSASTEIVISLPPKKPQQQGALVSMLQRFLPIIGTASGSLFFVFYIISDGNNLLLLAMALIVALIGILTGFLTGWTQRKTLKEKQERERKAYRDYLEIQSKKIGRNATKQQKYFRQIFPPDQNNLLEMARQSTQLWVRRIHEPDFLQVSMGLGKVDLYPPVSFQSSHDYLAEYDEESLQEQKKFQEQINNLLTQEPIVLNFRSVGVLTLVGERTHTRSLARALLSQLIVFHSPQDLRCLVSFPPDNNAKKAWYWLKWLPHTRLLRASYRAERSKEPFALLARQAEDLRWLLEQQVIPVLKQRREQLKGRHTQVPGQPRPHFLVLIDGLTLDSPEGQLLTVSPMMALLREAETLGLTVLCLVDDQKNELPQTKARITWTGGTLTFQEVKQDGQRLTEITPRKADVAVCYEIARRLAALKLAGVEERAVDLLRNFSLLDLLDILPVADMIRRRRERSQTTPDNLLRVPVGRNEQGQLVYLDLKESGDGPHGLLVGRTGSGKSELLRTLILALAVQHDTRTLNFVFIDFKGGASFTELKQLPHNAGLITNLESEPGLFERMVASLNGEVTRRQDLFSQVGAMDIQAYRAYSQSEKSLVVLPHLLLVVDETAELLTHKQHGPAFRELFISIGRVGRSLGIHLLLATQKVEGNAFYDLESSLRYRLCLHTNSPEESIAVLGPGRSDAYYLPATPGIGYLKVDDGELQKMKAALVSQPLAVPQPGDLARRIRTFTSTGSLAPIFDLPTTSLVNSAPLKEIQAIIRLLLELSEGAPRIRPVWQEPLPKALGLHGLEQWLGSDLSHPLPLWREEVPGNLQVSVGLVDRPQQQRQESLTLDFANGDGHLALVGAPQSGKSTFLRSLLMALMLTHSPSEVQIYIIDLAGGQFHQYQGLPHIGAVCFPGTNYTEDLDLTLLLMRQVIAGRQNLFRQQNLSTMADFRKKRQEGQYSDFAYGDVFLVIDNVAPFKQDVALGEEISFLLQSGPAAGVHLIFTANDWQAIRPAFLNLLGTYLELRLIVPENSRIDAKIARALPGNTLSTEAVPGRGLTKDRAQFQSSLPWIEPLLAHPGEQEEATLSYLKSQATKWSESKARPLPKLPFPIQRQKIQEMGGYGLLLGLQSFTMERYYLNLFEEGPHFQVWGDSKSGKTTLLRVCLEELQSRYPSTDVKIGVIESGAFRQPPLYQSVQDPYYLTNAWMRKPDSLRKSLSILKEHLQPRLQMDPDQAAREPVQTRYVLLVDSYDPNQVQNITEWVELVTWAERGEEIGFHIILTGSYTVATSTDRLVKMLKVASPGLLLSASTSPGKVLYDQAPTVQPYPGRGFIVRPGQRRLMIQAALPTGIAKS